MCEINGTIVECCGKESFIGDYAIYNCSCYGAYNTISTLEVGERLFIKFDKESNAIMVASDEECTNIIGELKIPEIDKRVFMSNLKHDWGRILYTCMLSQKNNNAIYDEMLRITIWINRFEKANDPGDTTTQPDATKNQANNNTDGNESKQ
ncbi:MAG: hypothetical protein II981_11785 [Bacteroidales bacterium]|nr:hypothetical protein [Bacteroidales bacterium]